MNENITNDETIRPDNSLKKAWVNANIMSIYEDELVISNSHFITACNGKITSIKPMESFNSSLVDVIYDIKEKLLMPGLIDCHTHLVYAGNRANEFEMRLNGASYSEIAQQGGGIMATVKATRKASFDELYQKSKQRLLAYINSGVTALEIKSGYGLDFDSEIKILKVAKKLSNDLPIHIETTFLGAHVRPPEFDSNQSYIDFICNELMPEIAKEKLASCVDVYCETLAFSVSESEQLFIKANELNLKVKMHAEQFSNLGGSELTAKYNGLSVDHIEYLDEDGVKALAQSKTVATLLPGAFYFLREKKMPPIDLLRKYGVDMAIATDSNPGTSPINSLPLMLNMASTLFGLTPTESIIAATINAAKALNLHKQKGNIKIGMDADFAIFDVDHPRDLVYSYNPNVFEYSVYDGNIVKIL